MALEPRIPKKTFQTKKCAHCGGSYSTEDFAQTHSRFYPDGLAPICNDCINDILREADYNWETIDKVCQWLDIPFIVREWERLAELNGVEKTWPVYASVFADPVYESLGWKDYFAQYKKLREAGMVEDELPLIHEHKIEQLQRFWGSNYDEEDLYYLQDLYKGLMVSQNVNGALQEDQAKKICKLSLEIDNRIRAGDKEVDKFLSSYDKLVKTAEFTPKNTKNAIDFDSFAEVGMWLEKRGRQNKFYDGTTRDVIDETLKNIQNYNQRLYINEGGIGNEITERLRALKSANEIENSVYNLQTEFDLDEYDDAGFNMREEEEEFAAEIEEEDEE